MLATRELLLQLIKGAWEHKLIAYDFETDSLNPYAAKIVGLSLSAWIAPQRAMKVYIPIGHESPTNPILGYMYPDQGEWVSHPDNWDMESVWEMVGPLLTHPEVTKIAHNAKYDLAVAHMAGLHVSSPGYDTMLASWCLMPWDKHGLKYLVKKNFNYDMVEFEALTSYKSGRGKPQNAPISRVQLEDAANYAADDAYWTLMLYELQQQQFIAEPGLRRLFDLENELMQVVLQMEIDGVILDREYLGEFDSMILVEARNIAQQLGVLGLTSPTSNQTVAGWFEARLTMSKYSEKKKNGYSVAGDVLEKIVTDESHGFESDVRRAARLLLQLRSLNKLSSTYTGVMPNLVLQADGRLHARFNQRGAATGRFSSDGPNLQNLPASAMKFGDLAYHVRKSIVAPAGWNLVSVDYSQIELRVLAALSNDPRLKDVFWNNDDAHTATASAVFNVPPSEVTKSQRQVGKTLNFAMAYGGGPGVIRRNTGLPWDECVALYESFIQAYPQIRVFAQRMESYAMMTGYIETILGRRVYLRQFDGSVSYTQAVNSPIQGSAAEIMKMAMVKVSREILEPNRDCIQMIMTVHDELVFYVRADSMHLVQQVVTAMETAYDLGVPLKVDAEFGRNWYELSDVPDIEHVVFTRDLAMELF